MSYFDFFDVDANKVASIQELKTDVDPSTGVSTKTYTEVDTVNVFLYSKSQAQSFIANRWSNLVVDIALCEPPVNIKENSKVVIDEVEYYAEVPEDIGNQGEVLAIGLKVTK